MHLFRQDIDLLKGLAIVAVVLYHAGVTQCGYLGVDAFFVINGFLVIPKVVNQVSIGTFRYGVFLEKRIYRLLPLLLLISAISLTVGYWGMLPQDLRYLSESVVATCLFGNNILQAITTQNYWGAIFHNILMHTWFVGILMQFYVVFPLLAIAIKWGAGKLKLPEQESITDILVFLSILSFISYLAPIDTISNKFYLLPYRFFEIGFGGLAGIYMFEKEPKRLGYITNVSFVVWLVLLVFVTPILFTQATPFNLVSGTNYYYDCRVPKSVLLIMTVALTLILLMMDNSKSMLIIKLIQVRIFNLFGKMSYSIFLLHQSMLAFYRYFYTDQFPPVFYIGFALSLFFLSALTYYYIEQCVRPSQLSRITLILIFLCLNALAIHAYHQTNGVSKSYEQYTDRIYQYDRDFPDSGSRAKVLIIGNSFARDFANILLESSLRDSICLSYRYSLDSVSLSRTRQCDRIFFFGWKHNLPKMLWETLKPDAQVWGIGPKNFGSSMGRIYKYRHKSEYYERTATIDPKLFAANDSLKKEWGACYVDLLTPLCLSDSSIRVFTPDRQMISFDGYHLTEEGARFMASYLSVLGRDVWRTE